MRNQSLPTVSPQTVRIVSPKDVLSAGRKVEIVCETTGQDIAVRLLRRIPQENHLPENLIIEFWMNETNEVLFLAELDFERMIFGEMSLNPEFERFDANI